MTVPAEPASGPPESPGSIRAVVASMPRSVSLNPAAPSSAWIVRPVPVMTPGETAGEPPEPAWFPKEMTGEPAATVAESPRGAAASPAAGLIRRTAISAATSTPTMSAW